MSKKVLLTIIVVALVSVANAAPLFTENFDSGIGANWSVLGTAGNIIAEQDPLSPVGDLALALKGTQDGTPAPTPTWGDAIYSVAGYNRADAVRIEFKVWYKNGVNVQAGMHGGWHYGTSGPQYATIEAAVDYVFSDFRASEAVNVNGIQSGPSMSFLNANWGPANQKSGALDVAITLDPVKGALFEVYDKVNAVWVVDSDTTAPLAYGGTAATAYIGFGPFLGQAGTTYIDDIVVTPEPVSLVLFGMGGLALLRRKRV